MTAETIGPPAIWAASAIGVVNDVAAAELALIVACVVMDNSVADNKNAMALTVQLACLTCLAAIAFSAAPVNFGQHGIHCLT